jgi:hypothetical protein
VHEGSTAAGVGPPPASGESSGCEPRGLPFFAGGSDSPRAPSTTAHGFPEGAHAEKHSPVAPQGDPAYPLDHKQLESRIDDLERRVTDLDDLNGRTGALESSLFEVWTAGFIILNPDGSHAGRSGP